VTICDGRIQWIAQARTRRGANASKRNSLKYARPHEQYEVRIIGAEDILEWDTIQKQAEEYRAINPEHPKRRIVLEE
jgi:hypothetical protein